MPTDDAPADDATADRLRSDLERTKLEVIALTEEFDSVAATLEHDNVDDEHDPEGTTTGFERARVRALLDAAKRRLSDIHHAMDRERDGEYGRCERCGDDIGDDRLAALPSTRTCIRCAASDGPVS